MGCTVVPTLVTSDVTLLNGLSTLSRAVCCATHCPCCLVAQYRLLRCVTAPCFTCAMLCLVSPTSCVALYRLRRGRTLMSPVPCVTCTVCHPGHVLHRQSPMPCVVLPVTHAVCCAGTVACAVCCAASRPCCVSRRQSPMLCVAPPTAHDHVLRHQSPILCVVPPIACATLSRRQLPVPCVVPPTARVMK